MPRFNLPNLGALVSSPVTYLSDWTKIVNFSPFFNFIRIFVRFEYFTTIIHPYFSRNYQL